MTQALGEASSRVGRPSENGSMGIIDPLCRMIALHIYDAIVKASTTPDSIPTAV